MYNDIKVRMDVTLVQNVLMTSSGSEHNRASGSSDEDDDALQKPLCNHTLHEVQSLVGKTPFIAAMSASSGIVVA